jgi:hypothetical protein
LASSTRSMSSGLSASQCSAPHASRTWVSDERTAWSTRCAAAKRSNEASRPMLAAALGEPPRSRFSSARVASESPLASSSTPARNHSASVASALRRGIAGMYHARPLGAADRHMARPESSALSMRKRGYTRIFPDTAAETRSLTLG